MRPEPQVVDQVQVGDLDQPAAGGAQRGQPALVGRAQAADRGHRRPAPGQPSPGEQGVPAVVARADQDQHPGAVDPSEQAHGRPGDRRGQPAGRALHQRVVADLGDRRGLELADRVDPVRLEHRIDPHASQITTAEAMPASWDRLTWMVAIPSSAVLAATVPVTLNSGRPRSSVTISASCQDSPAGAPSALASASLAANRAASDAGAPFRLRRG